MDTFTRAYIEAALWCGIEQDGETVEGNFYDIAPETLVRIESDCRDWKEKYGVPEYEDIEESNEAQAGHDFWLTRNHHGVGFWDRGLGDIGDKLTAAAHAYGEFNLYIGEDGKIYGE